VACLTDYGQSSALDGKSRPADKMREHNKVPVSPGRDFTHPAARPQEVSGVANAEGTFGSNHYGVDRHASDLFRLRFLEVTGELN